jgi:homoserine/homoserine lactone efflux protein
VRETVVTQLATAVPVFFAVSILPGLCMTLALTLGMTIGIRRTLWMMIGELTGVGLVAAISVVGMAAVMASHPSLYRMATFLGGVYLGYVGIRLLLADFPSTTDDAERGSAGSSPRLLARQGFVAAVANPKAWIFYASLFPPFVDPSLPLAPQLSILIAVMLSIEFASLLAYASGGHALKALLQTAGVVRAVNIAAGSAVLYVGGGLIFSV